MDFLEGFLVGPVWSDTEYRSRRHLSAHIVLAAVMAVAFVLLLLRPDVQHRLLLLSWPLPLILLLFFLILLPLMSIFYRRSPHYVRIFLLLFYAAKYVLLFYVLVHYFLPLFTFEKESVMSLLYDRMDDHIGVALETIAESGGILVTVAGVMAGGLWVIAESLAFLALLILVPLAAIALCKGLQYGIDWAVRSYLDRVVDSMGLYHPQVPGGQKKKTGPAEVTDSPGQRLKAGILRLAGKVGKNRDEK